MRAQLSKTEAFEAHRDLLASRTLASAYHPACRLASNYSQLALALPQARPYWRVRKCETDSGFPSLSNVLAPPPGAACVGRLNDAGAPRLYISRRIETALAELDAKPGEHFHAVGLFRIDDAP